MLDLLQHVPGIVGEGHLVLTLECLAPRIGLIIARAVTRIPNEVRETHLRCDEFASKPTGDLSQLMLTIAQIHRGPR